MNTIHLIDQQSARDEKQLRAHILTIILFTMLAASLTVTFVTWIFRPTPIIFVIFSATIFFFIAFLVNRFGHLQTAGIILLFTLIVSIFLLQYLGQGAHDLVITIYPILIIIASILLRKRALAVITAVAILAHGGIVYLEVTGRLQNDFSHVTGTVDFFTMGIVLMVTAVAMRLLTNQLWTYLAQTHANEASLRESNRQLLTQRNALQVSEEAARQFQEKLQTLHEINIQLGYCRTLDELYEKAIVYGRERLGFDRLGLLLYDEESQMMIGTFGTDEQGNLRDERSFHMKLNKPEIIKILTNKERMGFWETTDLLDEGQVVGRGWNALSILWNGKRGIGWLAADNLLKKEPATPMMLEILTLYGASLGYLVTVKQTEVALKQYALELERSNQELQEFAYIASHDLQEPLRKIQTFGDRLSDKYGSVLDERGLLYLERMQNAAARMQVLIQDLLAFSRVQSRGQPFVPVNLTETVRGVISDLETQIADLKAQFRLDELPVIYADKIQMRQLFQNLISNALKFHRPEEPPLITFTAVDIADPETGQAMCRISISDNGIGFDQQYAERIFGMFQRLHGRTIYDGSGIGLAICRRIVERHKGYITAEGQPNQGATFIITLPYNPD